MTQINEHLDRHPAPAPASDNTDHEVERVEMRSRWFSIKLEEINANTLAALFMILATVVAVVYIVTQA